MLQKLCLTTSMVVILISGCASVETDWKDATTADTVGAYRHFLNKHSSSTYSQVARDRIEQLDFEDARQKRTEDAINSFERRYPKSISKVEELRWAFAQSRDRRTDYSAFLRKYPDGRFAPEARKSYDQAFWKISSQVNSSDEYNAYLRIFPTGVFAAQALQKLIGLARPEPAPPPPPPRKANAPCELVARDSSAIIASAIMPGRYSGASSGVSSLSVLIESTTSGPLAVEFSYQFAGAPKVGKVAKPDCSPFGIYKDSALQLQLPILISLSAQANIFNPGMNTKFSYYRAEITPQRGDSLSIKLTQIPSLDDSYSSLVIGNVYFAGLAGVDPVAAKAYSLQLRRDPGSDPPPPPALPLQSISTTLEPLPPELECRVQTASVTFTRLRDGSLQSDGTIRGISCAGRTIELKGPKLVDGAIETNPFGRIQLRAPLSSSNSTLSIWVSPAQRKDFELALQHN